MPKNVNDGKRRWAIYRARKQKGLTMKQVGALVFTSDATVQSYEIGKQTPSTTRAWETFDAICKVLDITREQALPITNEKLTENNNVFRS